MKVFEILKYYLYLGSTCFGGPIAIIANMRNDLVERKKWVSEEEFENYFGYSQVAPGPIAFQVCIYISYFRAGLAGAIAGGFGLVLPSFLLVLLFSVFYQQFKDTWYITAMLYGISPVIISIILYSGIQLSSRVFKKDIFLYVLFSAAIILTAFLKFPIMYVILCSGIVSLIYYYIKDKAGRNLNGFFVLLPGMLYSILISINESYSMLKVFVNSRLIEMALLFMKVGALTYGSGFVIVGVLNQEVVVNYGYITSKEFIDGLAFGQITPGPVVITSTFIGYLTEGVLGAIVCTTAIFLPTFIIVVLIAPFMKKISSNFYVKSLIKGANAAAIGAIIATAYLLSFEAVTDYITCGLLFVSFALLFSVKVRSLYLIILSGIAGILLFNL
ncbi:MAG TPA: chromate efflux transporter [Ignavibacteria bacterium]|nr:chromate efflux transporter [Ignavibacteria bacterium]